LGIKRHPDARAWRSTRPALATADRSYVADAMTRIIGKPTIAFVATQSRR
jgi:hypothetical protein